MLLKFIKILSSLFIYFEHNFFIIVGQPKTKNYETKVFERLIAS